MYEKALKSIRSLLNLKEDEIPSFDLTNKEDKKYIDTIESINVLLDENEPESIKYLWNHLIIPEGYEMDLNLTEASKGFLQSYLYKRGFWLDNSVLYHSYDDTKNILRNLNTIYEGDLVRLRPATSSDIDLYKRHVDTDGDFQFYTMIPKEKASVESVCLNLLHPYSFLVEDIETKEAVGVVALRQHRKDLELTDQLEAACLSYYIYKEHRNKGYGEEASWILMDAYFKEELSGFSKTDFKFDVEIKSNKAISISLDCSEKNYASLSLARALGFNEEGIIHNLWFMDGEYSNGVFFYLTKEDYFKNQE